MPLSDPCFHCVVGFVISGMECRHMSYGFERAKKRTKGLNHPQLEALHIIEAEKRTQRCRQRSQANATHSTFHVL